MKDVTRILSQIEEGDPKAGWVARARSVCHWLCQCCWCRYNGGMTNREPHRKRIKHHHQPGDLHELTFSCYRRMPLLTNDDWRQRLSRKVQAACEETAFNLVAFVCMPEHLHLLVYYLLEPLKQQFAELPIVHGIPLGAFDKGQPR